MTWFQALGDALELVREEKAAAVEPLDASLTWVLHSLHGRTRRRAPPCRLDASGSPRGCNYIQASQHAIQKMPRKLPHPCLPEPAGQSSRCAQGERSVKVQVHARVVRAVTKSRAAFCLPC
jgi:hypothetical protein